jgi:hypothetical protein
MALPFRLTMVKASPYQAEPAEKWANDYCFAGATPVGDAWNTLAAAVWAIEGSFIQADIVRTHLVTAYGYAPGSTVSEITIDYTDGGSTPGTAPSGTSLSIPESAGVAPISDCSLMRWNSGARSTSGKPVYLYKYYHDTLISSINPNEVSYAAGAAAELLHFTDGTLPGAVVLAMPNGDSVILPGLNKPYITTHQLKRRGKRPTRG